ncbi:MAG TPA: hypothetical protein VMT21_13045, partial [Gemmatimonadales bacterium]|nr:hypothetical protein [Gemmatimonadales bacterium]
MRSLRFAVLPLLVATSLAAQAPEPSIAPPAPVAAAAPARTAFLDLAALVGDRQRFGLEPLVFGRWTVGLIGSHYSTGSPTYYGTPVVTDLNVPGTVTIGLCPIGGCPPTGSGSTSSYAAWSLDFAVRYYPAALSLNDPRRRLMVYIGEFVGYQWRTITQVSYPPVAVPLAGSTQAMPCAYPGCSGQVIQKQHFTGWEPGAEVGVRLKPLDPLFIDVGGWFKIVGVDDPYQRLT